MDILSFLVTVHSMWRWAVLFGAVVALVASVAGFLGMLPAGAAAAKASRVFVTVIDIQFLIGAVIWLGKGWYAIPGFYQLEHPLTMLLAVVLAHVGAVMVRRSKGPRRAAGWVAVTTLLSLIFVVVGIPGVVRPA